LSFDLPKRAGVPSRTFHQRVNRTSAEIEADELRILQWNDQELDGKGFINWYPFDHPQLGPVELGGWNTKYVRQNPPGHLLEEEIHGSVIYTLKHAAASPRLEVEKLQTEALSDGLHRLQLVVVNSGYIATNITETALRQKLAKPVEVRLACGPGIKLLDGQAKTELGHIPGFGKKQTEWVLTGSGKVEITIWSEKAGTVRKAIKL
jgi:hypothetical protein